MRKTGHQGQLGQVIGKKKVIPPHEKQSVLMYGQSGKGQIGKAQCGKTLFGSAIECYCPKGISRDAKYF